MSSFHYIDPRGRRSGPYSEAELKLLMQRGLLEPGGEIELEGLSTRWPVADVPWLRSDGGPAAATAVPPEPVVPPLHPFTQTPPTSPVEAMARPLPPDSAPIGEPACSRVAYVLIALLLPFVGLFGVHNVVAGYTTRGVVAIILSATTIFGIGCFVFPCTCVGVPMWIVLFTLTVIDVFTVRCDARGRAFS